MLDEHPAARAERQAVDVLGAIAALRAVVRARGFRGRVADGLKADVAGRRNVLIDMRRCDAQDLGDVVEAITRGVGRQHRARVDLHAEQVVDGRRVLRAVDAVQRHIAGLRAPLARGGVEIALERRDEFPLRGRIGPRFRRRRHEIATQFANDLFESCRLRGHVLGLQSLEREVAREFGVVVAVLAVVKDVPVPGDDFDGRRLAATAGRGGRQHESRSQGDRAGAATTSH